MLTSNLHDGALEDFRTSWGDLCFVCLCPSLLWNWVKRGKRDDIFISFGPSAKLPCICRCIHIHHFHVVTIILYILCYNFLALSNPFFCLGRLGRKSCSYTMCKSNGNPEVCVLFHSQLRQASWSSINGNQVLHWEVSSGYRSNPHHNPVVWFHAGIFQPAEVLANAYDIVTENGCIISDVIVGIFFSYNRYISTCRWLVIVCFPFF